MYVFLTKLISVLDGFSEAVGRTISWLTLAMVVITFIIVVMRYLFQIGNIALQESVVYMHSFIFLLAAAYTLKHDGHVRVDIFYRPLSERKKAWVNLIGTVFLLLPVCAVIFYFSWDYVAQSWTLKESSQEAGGIAYLYVLKSSIIIMPIMVILQGISELARCILTICNHGHLCQEDILEHPL